MISRASAKAIAEAYHERFTSHSRSSRGGSIFELHVDALYDFLYVNNFDAWFLNGAKGKYPHHQRQLLEFLLRVHTGESLINATAEWSWKQRQALGQRLLSDLAKAIIASRMNDPNFETYGSKKKDTVDAMRRLLELDGYIYKEGVLLVPEESVVDEQEEQGVLERLYSEVGLQQRDVFDHHLRLSSEHYRVAKWDDSIANSRKVLEVVLQQAAARLGAIRNGGLQGTELDKPVRVRDYLEQAGLLEQKEKEVIAKIYAVLSDTGAHPYIAQQDQARLLRHYALTTSQFTLLRLRGALLGGAPAS